MRMLKKQGVEISVKQTEEVLKLLRMLSEIAVSQYLAKNNEKYNRIPNRS